MHLKKTKKQTAITIKNETNIIIWGKPEIYIYIYIYRTFTTWSLEFSNTTGALKFIRRVFLLLLLLLRSVKVPGGSYSRSASPRTS